MVNMTQSQIYTRGKKLWIRFSLDAKKIRKPLHLDDTKANRKLANTQIIPNMILKIHTGEFFENQTVQIPTIDEYVKVSFELNRGNRCYSTQYGYEKNYNRYIKNVFGHLRLDELTPHQITLWQNNLQDKERLAKSSILKVRTILYTLYEDAIIEDIIDKNPVRRVKPLKRTENTKVKRLKLEPFSLMEIEKILKYAQNGQQENIIATLFYTGVRCGELIGLKWQYVNFQNKTIAIRNQIVEGEEKELLKTTRSQRTIPMIDILIPYLKSQYQLTGHLNSYVFITEKTHKFFHSAGKIREQIWVKTLKRANVRYRNLHQTRGTFISTLISNGEDINFVSKIAGHENVRVTLENYSEYIPMQNSEFGKCFSD